jgi:hypothetical protein
MGIHLVLTFFQSLKTFNFHDVNKFYEFHVLFGALAIILIQIFK